MTKAEIMAKDFQERDMQRQGAVALWGRSWKADLVIALKTEHEELCRIHEANLKRFPRLETDAKAEDERAGKLAKIAWEMLRDTREMMMAMALHPTRPKGHQESRGGGRPRKAGDGSEPIEAVQVEIPMPRPEVDVPRGTRENT